MTLNARDFTLPGYWAKEANTNIPPISIKGQPYRDAALSKTIIENGQNYGIVADSAVWNQLMYLVSGIAGDAEKYGIPRWSPLTYYAGDASLCIGTDGIPYRAVQDSGPGTGDGQQDPTTTTGYWQTFAEYIGGGSGGGGGGGGTGGSGNTPLGGCDFLDFQTPPGGWMVANGALITSASIVVPELVAALQLPENAWRLASESDWKTQSASAPWNGIGGVKKLVLDLSADTVRLPDIRGMYMESAGFNNLSSGDVHGDAIRNIPGTFTAGGWLGYIGNVSGAFAKFASIRNPGMNLAGGNVPMDVGTFTMDVSKVVPTSIANMPRAFGMLGCVYVGAPAS